MAKQSFIERMGLKILLQLIELKLLIELKNEEVNEEKERKRKKKANGHICDECGQDFGSRSYNLRHHKTEVHQGLKRKKKL